MLDFPLYEEISPVDPIALFAAIPQEGAIYFDSANSQSKQGRYSFIAFDPYKIIICKNETEINPFDLIAQSLQFQLQLIPDLPPFQGGVAGMFGYELGGYLEKIPRSSIDDLAFPELILGCYDVVFAWDHLENRAFVFSSGFPEIDKSLRQKRAEQRLSWALEFVQALKPLAEIKSFQVPESNIASTFTQSKYETAVERVIEYIRAGDIFEANISQRYSTQVEQPFSPFELYRKLRRNNPAPFAVFMQYQDYAICSASPERFLQLRNGIVEARPIKGTRPRHADPKIDHALGEELLESEKDRAENIMIVDLMRNDISRVCKPHSIKVPQLCGLESFTTVHHLVSAVEGELSPGKTALDLLKATFPGGSITGAPKIRTMEIIAEMEPTLRGPYCGSMGYIGFNGCMDLSITIRTYAIHKNFITFQTGGAITVDSDPHEEYLETLAKAKALRNTLIYD